MKDERNLQNNTLIQYKVEETPSADTIQQIYEVALDYTKDYFTDNLPTDTQKDLMFQQVIYLKGDKQIVSFIIFTCWDGTINITLMSTRRNCKGKGYGSKLMMGFEDYIRNLGLHEIELLTVPPKVKPIYANTVAFYESVGFQIVQEYTELWESGAIKMSKNI